MKPLKFNSLNFGAKAGLCWSFFWRGIVIAIVAGVVAGVLGGVFGFAVALAGFRGSAAQMFAPLVGMAIGGVVGMVCLSYYIRWLLGARMGRFRLFLVDMTAPTSQPAR